MLNMTSYGHVDMMDQAYIDIIQVLVSVIYDILITIIIKHEHKHDNYYEHGCHEHF